LRFCLVRQAVRSPYARFFLLSTIDTRTLVEKYLHGSLTDEQLNELVLVV
jgi:hypothetical protein